MAVLTEPGRHQVEVASALEIARVGVGRPPRAELGRNQMHLRRRERAT